MNLDILFNTDPEKSFCLATFKPRSQNHGLNMTVGKEYTILDGDPSAIGPGMFIVEFYLRDDADQLVWVSGSNFVDIK